MYLLLAISLHFLMPPVMADDEKELEALLSEYRRCLEKGDLERLEQLIDPAQVEEAIKREGRLAFHKELNDVRQLFLARLDQIKGVRPEIEDLGKFRVARFALRDMPADHPYFNCVFKNGRWYVSLG